MNQIIQELIDYDNQTSTAERRDSPRTPHSTKALVNIISIPRMPELEGRQFACQAADVSLRGVRIQTDLFIPTNATLTLHITLVQSTNRYLFAGRIAWCKKSSVYMGMEEYEAGIEIDHADAQYTQWRDEILLLLSD